MTGTWSADVAEVLSRVASCLEKQNQHLERIESLLELSLTAQSQAGRHGSLAQATQSQIRETYAPKSDDIESSQKDVDPDGVALDKEELPSALSGSVGGKRLFYTDDSRYKDIWRLISLFKIRATLDAPF